MGSRKNSVTDHISLQAIEQMALPSNLRYGRAIHERGAVEFIEFGPSMVEAWVGGLNGTVAAGGSQRRRTRLFITPKGLGWHCTGNPKTHDVFCKHCVALALAILDRS